MPNSSPNFSTTTWQRVTKSHPCPICQKHHWCLLSPDRQVVICMRLESQKPKLFKSGEMGWFHRLDQPLARYNPTTKPNPPPTINCRKLIEEWTRQTKLEMFETLARDLGVSRQALRSIQACYASPHHAWAFPMKDGYDNMVGIRLRNYDGRKWAVPGSHQGCFLPDHDACALALVAEGPTDCAAGLDLGYYCVGRPSCSGGMNDLRQNFVRRRVRRAAIISDNDKPGTRGAQMLSTHLGVPTCIVVLPCKDLRQFLQLGGDRGLMDSYVESALWTQPT